ncbi:multiple sugar transport system substrate-binding protein [Friedmanniella endophytica]|uniref:Multiple sugar transport system substrate-binding protein n=1 Tax=Microlunatus kandeliicorticis TaxID=1759536 RepID=A0A7W3IQ11_9ACTN|nr:sugar ABC transporter substrate-binding protein [Microlunatus kandeliicorticis]MBA8793142.1 multiple sugar transport system substrate-binding protein [Microlunatus kandeliicorticis]
MTRRPVSMTRRQLLAALGTAAGAVAGSAALGGCSNAAARWGFSGNPDSAKANLTYALWDTYQQEGYQKSIDQFTAKHPDISVTIQQIPYGNYAPKITASFISGNAPDLFWVNTPFLADWIRQGIIADVTDRVRAANIDTSVYVEGLVELHEREGKLYGLPKDWDTICFYYNKSYFQKLGVSAPTEQLEWNPDDGGTFLKFLRTITSDSKGKTADQPGFDPGDIVTYAVGNTNDPQSGYGSYLPMNGGAFIAEPYAARTVLDTAPNRETISFLSQMLVDEHVQIPYGELGPNADGSSALTLFAQGRLALFQAGDWNTSSISELTSNFEVGTFLLPRGPQGGWTVFNGLTDGTSTATEHPEQTWLLAEWLGGADSQRIMGSGGYIWPAIESLDPLYAEHWKKNKVDVSAFLTAAQGKKSLYPVAVGMAEAVSDVQTALAPTFFGTASAATGLAKAQQVADYRISSGA